MTHTKKVGSTGRFGARYGLRLRKKILEIEQFQRQKQKCPFCLKFTAKRLASGIWLCRHCKTKFAGRAYVPGVLLGKSLLEIPKEKAEEIKHGEAREEKAPERKPKKKKKIIPEKEEPNEPEPTEELINAESQEEADE